MSKSAVAREHNIRGVPHSEAVRDLAWAFVEAAHYAIHWNEQVRRFRQRKRAKTMRAVALKAVAHKLGRACYDILHDDVNFDVNKAFG